MIECRDSVEVIRQQDTPDTLFYLDPPYPKATRNARHGYGFEMCEDDHRKLAEVLTEIEGMAVLSSYPCDLYEDLYSGWKRVTKKTQSDGGGERTEVLWINEAAQENQAQRELFDG